MVNEELFEEYSRSIRRIREQCSDAGISAEEFRRLYFDSLNSLDNSNRHEIPRHSPCRKYKAFFLMCVVLLGCICITYNFKTIYSSLVCNLQEYIYPGLKLLRRLAIPFVSLFPSLTEWYHETCLIQNPFFSVVDMDCWPCSSVSNVREVNDPKPGHHQNAPFIYETDQQVLPFESIQQLYMTNKDTLNSNILVNNKLYTSPEELFNEKHIKDKNYYIWRFDDMNAARVLRQLVPRPKVVPKFGQSTERFLIMDSSQKMFQIPDTECSFSFLLCLSGNRVIDLVPAEECTHQCKTLKVELKETYLLWYNWWYWRPKGEPSNGNSTFIAHVGSYC